MRGNMVKLMHGAFPFLFGGTFIEAMTTALPR